MTENRQQMVGWLLFVGCALFYGIANVRARDWLSLVGTILFVAACLVFMGALRRR